MLRFLQTTARPLGTPPTKITTSIQLNTIRRASITSIAANSASFSSFNSILPRRAYQPLSATSHPSSLYNSHHRSLFTRSNILASSSSASDPPNDDDNNNDDDDKNKGDSTSWVEVGEDDENDLGSNDLIDILDANELDALYDNDEAVTIDLETALSEAEKLEALVQSAVQQRTLKRIFEQSEEKRDPLFTASAIDNADDDSGLTGNGHGSSTIPAGVGAPPSSGSSNGATNESGGNNNSNGSNRKRNPPAAVRAQFTEAELHDWGVEDFRPVIIFPAGPAATIPGTGFMSEKTNASSANIPRPKDVHFVGLPYRMIQLPGQPFSISLPIDLLTTLRTQQTIAEMKGAQKRGQSKRLFIGLFFQKDETKEVNSIHFGTTSKNTKPPSSSKSPDSASPSTSAAESSASSIGSNSSTIDATSTSSTTSSTSSSPSNSPSALSPASSSSSSSSSPVSSSSSSSASTSTTGESMNSDTSLSYTSVDLSQAFESVGLLAEVVSFESDSNYVLVLCHRRISLDPSRGAVVAAIQPHLKVYINHHDDATWNTLKPLSMRYNPELITLKNDCLKILRTIRTLEGQRKFDARQKAYFTFNNQSPGSIIDYWCTLSSSSHYAVSTMTPIDQQLLAWTRGTLTNIPLIPRLKCVHNLLQHELKLVQKQKMIETETKLRVEQEQLELLTRQKKAIEAKIALVNRPLTNSSSETATADSTMGTTATEDLRSEKEKLLDRWTERIKAKTIPPDVLIAIDEEMEKFRSMDAEQSFEYSSVRNYLDWLTVLPWGIYTPERYDVKHAESILNKEHFGMEDVKQRILEFIATSKLVGSVPQGKIICLVGPPGVGKTSIGKSIAHSLQREFYRFSVGGMDDVSEIKGHRRTYVGSMPGKLVQSLKRVNTSNPVILIDEIDKLGRGGMRGDPSSALLEVLDPEQNNAFMDQYLDVPVDLSKVLFICTANDRSLIPGPLADRMDFIELSGYLATEKVAIASQYLEPAIRERTGVTKDQLEITPEALFHLIRWYCREAGVRSLQKYLEKIYRKVALKMAREAKRIEKEENKTTTPNVFSKVTLTPSNLSEYAGPPNFISDKLYEVNPIGVATGLAYTSHGGAVLFIESVVADVTHAAALASQIPRAEAIREEIEEDYEDERDESNITHPSDTDANPANDDNNPTKFHYGGRGELFCTGSLGNVMKESSSIAYTVAKRILAQRTSINSIHRHFFDHHRIHLHFPSGAIPKDGPSAGIAMVTSLISLAIQTEPIVGHAMTGELTLTGKVLPIGGVKEKLMAAKHAGINLIVLPEGNRKDVDELKPYVIEGLDIKYAKHYDDVFSVIFPNFQDTLRQPTTPAHHLPTYNRRAEIHA